MRAVVQSQFAEDPTAPPRRGQQKSRQIGRICGWSAAMARSTLGRRSHGWLRSSPPIWSTTPGTWRTMRPPRTHVAQRYAAASWSQVSRDTVREFIKHTGDGFLAEFPSATQAVWFAVRFQDAVRIWNARRVRARRFEFRIGINLGDVIVQAHDVFGHSVNIAARLELIARPGGVLVSHAVFVSVRDPRLLFEDAGDLSLRNVDEPVRGFHARLSASARPRRGA